MSDLWADAPPGPGRLRWRLGVLDHDLTNGDLQASAEEVADWYVEDVARLLALLDRLEWAGQPVPGERIGTRPRCPVCRVTQPPHDRGCWLDAVLHPEREESPHP